MFRLSAERLDVTGLRQALARCDAGAIVDFEGHVRAQNAGRRVNQLEYEGAADLASTTFVEIEAEARNRFEILDIHCVHRTGLLDVGDIAVWIGVAAAHRDAAFDACRYTIDELKQRLPIWKKEHYVDGESTWLSTP
jgi:molybdopterin synthase catalytic subunit